MGNMRFKVGDRVQVKSIDWYNENKDEYGNFDINDDFTFYADRSKYCGKVVTITEVFDNCYSVKEDNDEYYWIDEMFEELMEEETKPEPKFKVGDKIKLKSTLLNDIFGVIGCEPEGYRITNISNGLTYFMHYSIEHHYELIEEKCDYVQVDNIPDTIQAKTSSVCSHNGFYGYNDSEGNETSEWHLPEGYQFVDEDGNVINAQKIVLEKKKPRYPKTYKECCEIMGVNYTNDLDICEHCDYKTGITYYEDSLLEKIETLYRLIICRDAYWKIAGEKIGLDKLWEPDWNSGKPFYCISVSKNIIGKGKWYVDNKILAFPTEEMRDAFYEAFKELIEECKELL